MLYLCSSSSKEIGEHTSAVFGGFATPKCSSVKFIKMGRTWGGDNGAFTNDFDEIKFFKFLDKMKIYQSTNLFIACPDKVYHSRETLVLYKKYAGRIKELGYTVALVTQDGLKANNKGVFSGDVFVPFSEIDWFFIGGSNEHKDGDDIVELIKTAKKKGIKIHVGRVNGKKRLWHFRKLGVDTVDGTHVNFEPKKAIRDIEMWIKGEMSK